MFIKIIGYQAEIPVGNGLWYIKHTWVALFVQGVGGTGGGGGREGNEEEEELEGHRGSRGRHGWNMMPSQTVSASGEGGIGCLVQPFIHAKGVIPLVFPYICTF